MKNLEKYLNHNFPSSLLLLGDLTSILIHKTKFISIKSLHKIIGVGVLYAGFDTPIISIVADNHDVTLQIIERLTYRRKGFFLLGLHSSQSYLGPYEAIQKDIWMIRNTCKFETNGVQKLHNLEELSRFYKKQGMHFWDPNMIKFNNSFGIRYNGKLISAISTNFILSKFYYAQLGPVATDISFREKGFATKCFHSLINNLFKQHILFCGLFANLENSNLIKFYSNLGFNFSEIFYFYSIYK